MADEIIHFDGSNLRALTRDLRAAAREFRLETDKTLARIGTEILIEAKALAGRHSQTVADTISMRVAPGVVIITAGSESVPIAALWELGNKGGSKDTASVQGVTFRHPVFGNTDVWVNQRRFPFLRPAAQAERRRITQLMNETYDRALEPYRLKPTKGL